MAAYRLSETVCLEVPRGDDPCLVYAAAELNRLLGRLGVSARTVSAGGPEPLHIRLGAAPDRLPEVGSGRSEPLAGDSYVLSVTERGVLLEAGTPKGLLNAVYDLAERLGVLFLLPEETGEWLPEGGPRPLVEGRFAMTPRFPHRGVFLQSLEKLDYSDEAWLRFYAKLRMNAVSTHEPPAAVAREVGLRLETGGHGLSRLLPRDRFEETPELFRLFQPEDFGGKRMKDSNLCVTHPESKRIIQEHFLEALDAHEKDGVYAVHAWADDLPAGGWCLCPSCRALSAPDQAMLAMRHLAEAARRDGRTIRVPAIAYHDTMRPGATIPPPPEAYLLFAPRERCYGHALDDPRCRRNRFYLQALEEWTAAFAGIDDAHTFEYYFDQILFRGIYPFLPNVILEDMRVYADHGIETHMSLQVGGPAVAPEYNMLLFARAAWEPALTARDFVHFLADRIAPEKPEAWVRYLLRRGLLFEDAMRMCDHPLDIYLDYRWLPETTHPFGETMAAAYAAASTSLDEEAARLGTDAGGGRAGELAAREAARARFEAAELAVMAEQQQGMNALGRYLATGEDEARRKGIAALRTATERFGLAHAKAVEAGLPEQAWYYGNINRWLAGEFERKAASYEASASSR